MLQKTTGQPQVVTPSNQAVDLKFGTGVGAVSGVDGTQQWSKPTSFLKRNNSAYRASSRDKLPGISLH